jgi:3-hydroxyacyl-[acyl-carrier-protein] dehydratase
MRLKAASTASASAAPADPLAHLPHAAPFRFVSSVTSVKPRESAEGIWEISGSEDFFRGHFPGNPIVPGVLISEALAQLSGIAGSSGTASGKSGMLAHVDVRFEKPVAPPATIVLRSTVTGTMGSLQKFDVSRDGEQRRRRVGIDHACTGASDASASLPRPRRRRRRAAAL